MNINSSSSHAVYVPGARMLFDLVTPDGRTRSRGLTIDQVRRETGAQAEILPLEEVIGRIELITVSPPVLVSAERYVCMRDVLPLLVRTSGVDDDTESFQLAEFTVGRVTRTLVRVGAMHWEFLDRAERPHHELVAKVRRKLNEQLLAELAQGIGRSE